MLAENTTSQTPMAAKVMSARPATKTTQATAGATTATSEATATAQTTTTGLATRAPATVAQLATPTKPVTPASPHRESDTGDHHGKRGVDNDHPANKHGRNSDCRGPGD